MPLTGYGRKVIIRRCKFKAIIPKTGTLVGEYYRVTFSKEYTKSENCQCVFIPPFQEQGIDLEYVYGM